MMADLLALDILGRLNGGIRRRQLALHRRQGHAGRRGVKRDTVGPANLRNRVRDQRCVVARQKYHVRSRKYEVSVT